jgi:hypothetical protein
MAARARADEILAELRRHAPFTLVGTLSGVLILWAMRAAQVSPGASETLFWTFHPIHVVLSALATAAMHRLHASRGVLRTIAVGYVGSIGIATLSDSLIPYVGEWLLDLPNRGVHIGFIEKWWLVNPLALLGVAVACLWPRTQFPHAGHVFLSTWASVFHVMMAVGDRMTLIMLAAVAVFLFFAVLLPCCTSDIVFPLLFVRKSDLRVKAGRAGTGRLGT